jgi:hypothetical protein
MSEPKKKKVPKESKEAPAVATTAAPTKPVKKEVLRK